jgi:hypothetical protein
VKFLTRLRALREVNAEATRTSEKVLEQADRSVPEIDKSYKQALSRLAEATAQANTLSGMDRRNHYSESLTESFQGRTA